MATSVLVIGTGTIGEPLIGLLCDHREDFGIDEVMFHKRSPLRTDRSKVLDLIDRRGARLAVDEDRVDDFRELRMKPDYLAGEAMEKASVIIDCTPVGNQNKERIYGDYLDNTKGFIAQGSEFGFGKMYARGINDQALVPGEDRFLHVVSCNTHNLAVILQTIAFPPESLDKANAATTPAVGDTSNLEAARFLCIRRSNDISQDLGFVPSPTIDRHKDAEYGTHHARDVVHLYDTLGFRAQNVFSSAIKLNTQYMHTVHFSLRLKKPTTKDAILESIHRNDRLAVTWKMSVNAVFSFGRDHGHFGRILNQTVFCVPGLHVSKDGHEVTGYCFTPQDGNPLLSSISGMLWFLDPSNYEARTQKLEPYFFQEV
jgi:glyceraldehyde-3-phosphate dehydrogenase/erythrose-4-phosphate dehydrogenase